MIIIADSGSTKTDWCVVNHGKQVKRITTEGTNPFFQTEEEISQVVKDKLMPHLDGVKIDAVYFYGAGCAFPEKNEIVHNAIYRHIPVTIEVGSDLLAAARSLCGHKAGIACIMGTGSNSCYYDGKEIVNNISPLGYILGDEGSGAVLGKLLVGDCLKNQLTPELKEKFSTASISRQKKFWITYTRSLSPIVFWHRYRRSSSKISKSLVSTESF